MALAGIAASPGVANAQIQCFGRYQISEGRLISTPFCEDEYLAYVARTYGARTSGFQMRNDLGERNTICRWIGWDTRLRSICNLDDDNDPFKRRKGR